ncbi:MAG: hypothetical protein AAFR65_02185 [Pseudomonadota bacterium]
MSSSRSESAKTEEDALDRRLREVLDERLSDAPTDRLKARLRAAKAEISESVDPTTPPSPKP